MRPRRVAALVCALTASLPVTAQVEIEWRTVGNPGNASDAGNPFEPFGSVEYAYRISATEITNDQYAAFLNAIAATDPTGLYSTEMASDANGGITRSGTDGSYTYTVEPDMGNKPVIEVSWYDAARFCNWVTNGQLTGSQNPLTTEAGVYTFDGPSSVTAITRDMSNPNQVSLPTENEWYKAAYHQPASSAGDGDDYWNFATQSNAVPTPATATSTGEVGNPGPGVVNYDRNANWTGGFAGNVTTVGSAGSTTFYGVSDMNGNVAEWTETSDAPFGISEPVVRGGSYQSLGDFRLRATFRSVLEPGLEASDRGFRVASSPPPPPEPFVIDWVEVGNAGNAPDPTFKTDGTTGYGSVAHPYRVGLTEVTNAQYTDFLNAVAQADPDGLYNTDMGDEVQGGITRDGTAGSYTYAIKPNMGDKPVVLVSWYDAARFCNWVTNGQGLGDTESGVYTFDGPASISAISRDLNNPDQVFLPTEDEWHKAAYHHPAVDGGDADDFWMYATQSNTQPIQAIATPTGDVANPGPDIANYGLLAIWNGVVNVTTAGSAGNTTHYGAFDMSGNVWEWNQTAIGTERGICDAGFASGGIRLMSSWRESRDPTDETILFGFRLASPALPPPCPGDIADDFGTVGNADGQVSFGDFLALLGLVGPCPGMTPGCDGDIADDFGTLSGGDGMVSFGDFLALLGLVGPCP